MTFLEQCIQDSMPIWQDCLESEFVQGVAHGTLPEECFKGYIVDDSLYLREYSKVFAWGILHSHDMEKAAQAIGEAYGCAVLCKGGHDLNDANDLLWRNGTCKWFHGRRIDNPNTHGTGCTLSSAIASNLAKGYDLDTAVERAKAYLSGALAAMLDLGAGQGPMDHLFDLKGEYVR